MSYDHEEVEQFTGYYSKFQGSIDLLKLTNGMVNPAFVPEFRSKIFFTYKTYRENVPRDLVERTWPMDKQQLVELGFSSQEVSQFESLEFRVE